MMGFWVTVAAMVMTGWIVYAATYRAAYVEGFMDCMRQVGVPTGTKLTIGNACPDSQGSLGAATQNPLRGQQCNCMVPDPCYNGDVCIGRTAEEVYANTGNPHG